jgi:Glycosyl transferase family 2
MIPAHRDKLCIPSVGSACSPCTEATRRPRPVETMPRKYLLSTWKPTPQPYTAKHRRKPAFPAGVDIGWMPLHRRVLALREGGVDVWVRPSRHTLASAWDLSWHPNARHIVEHKLGIAVARRRGMREASTDLLIFVDDDNLLDRDYLLETVRIKHEWHRIGVWGSGAIVPALEIQPPTMFSNSGTGCLVLALSGEGSLPKPPFRPRGLLSVLKKSFDAVRT